eukprot:8880259-Pyramimonas_sp.AAC.2
MGTSTEAPVAAPACPPPRKFLHTSHTLRGPMIRVINRRRNSQLLQPQQHMVQARGRPIADAEHIYFKIQPAKLKC